jgi:hypothetical protein
MLYSTTWLFLVRIWVVNMKNGNFFHGFEKNSILSQKTVKKPVFPRVLISPPRISKSRRTKVVWNMKGNFSVLAVKWIREQSKNDIPYCTPNSFKKSKYLRKNLWKLEKLKNFSCFRSTLILQFLENSKYLKRNLKILYVWRGKWTKLVIGLISEIFFGKFLKMACFEPFFEI